MRTICLLVVLALAVVVATPAYADSITLDLDEHFGATASDGTLSVTFTDITLDDNVTSAVRITFNAGALATDEHVKNWYFSFSGDGGTTFDASALSFAHTGETDWDTSASGSVTITQGANRDKGAGGEGMQADGDGIYNLLVEFASGESDNRFIGGETISIVVTGSGISASDFIYIAATGGGNGPFYSASHVGSTGTTNADSDWLGAGSPVPEPGTLVLLGLGLAGLGARRRRSAA